MKKRMERNEERTTTMEKKISVVRVITNLNVDNNVRM